MSRRAPRFLRAVARLLRPFLRDAKAELLAELRERLFDDDLISPWINSKAEQFDRAHDFSSVPIVGEHLEQWDDDAVRQALWLVVEELRDDVRSRGLAA